MPTNTTLERVTPESQGLSSSAVSKFVEAVESQIHEVHSFMLLRHGKVVAEGWWSPYAPEHPHMLFSLSKSYTATAVGLAASEGCFSLDDKVVSFFPDDVPAKVSKNLAAMKVRHLLSMSTGQDTDTMPPMGSRADGNWTKAFFEVPVVHKPGTHFLYNTGATYMLSAIVQKTTGMRLTKYLKPRLFDPLGITNPVWQLSPQGIETGGFGLSVTTEDIARFGQLYLQKGIWNGKQLLPDGWVEEATKSHISNGDDPKSDWAQGYGFQFWRCRNNAYRGDGAFGQYCVVIPELDVVLAITSGLGDMQQPLNLVWDILLPSFGDVPRRANTAAHKKLTEKVTSLSIAPVAGEATSAKAAKLSKQVFNLAENDYNFKSVGLKFSKTGSEITLKRGRLTEVISCGYGLWQAGETRLFNQPYEKKPVPIVSSGAWTAKDTYTAVIRFYETPFYHTFEFHAGKDEVTVDTRVNVSFEPPKTVTLKGSLNQS